MIFPVHSRIPVLRRLRPRISISLEIIHVGGFKESRYRVEAHVNYVCKVAGFCRLMGWILFQSDCFLFCYTVPRLPLTYFSRVNLVLASRVGLGVIKHFFIELWWIGLFDDWGVTNRELSNWVATAWVIRWHTSATYGGNVLRKLSIYSDTQATAYTFKLLQWSRKPAESNLSSVLHQSLFPAIEGCARRDQRALYTISKTFCSPEDYWSIWYAQPIADSIHDSDSKPLVDGGNRIGID